MEARTALLSAPLVTAEEIARLLKVSPKTIYRWASEGRLPAFREGRLVRFLESDVEGSSERGSGYRQVAWIEGRRAKGGTVTWFVYWREAGRRSAKKSVKAGTRRRDAERLAVEIQARVNAGLVGGGVIAKRCSFGEFADKWLAARIVRPTTLRRDKGLINTYLRPRFAGTLLNAITVEEVCTLVGTVTREQSASTARRLLAVLGKMLADAVKCDYVRQNPVERLDRRDKPQARRNAHPIDMEELSMLLETVCGRWAVFALVAVLTGLRWGELAALEWSDLDFEVDKINVRRATPAGTKGPQDLKSRTSQRSIDLLWPFRQALLDLPQRGQLIFPGTRGGPLNHGWFNRQVWRQATQVIGSSLRFHDMRHGFASLLLAWGEPILYVSQQLGHSSAAFTLSTYAHLIQQGRKLDKEETLQKLVAAAKCESCLIGRRLHFDWDAGYSIRANDEDEPPLHGEVATDSSSPSGPVTRGWLAR